MILWRSIIMHEMITLKKHGPTWIHAAVAGVLVGGFFFLESKALTYYLTERHYGRLSGGGKVLWFLICFFLILLCLESVSFFTGYLITLITDRDKYVTVRKSSMDNARAAEIYQKYRKRCRMIKEIEHLALYLLLAVILMLYSLKSSPDKTILIVVFFFIIMVMAFNPLTGKQIKKARTEMNSYFLVHCDAALEFDIYEHSRLYMATGRERDLQLLMQAELSYFLGDYREMASKLSQSGRHMNGAYKMIHIYYRGLYALDTGDRTTFYICCQELDAYLNVKKSMPPPLKNIGDILRKELRIRVDLIDGDPVTMIPVIIQMIPAEKTRPDWMNRTFQLAWLQLKVGDVEQAVKNLRLVADGAGTMAIRNKSIELLQKTGTVPET